MQDKENFPNDLFKVTGNQESDTDSDDDFNPPPPPKFKKKKNPNSTISKPLDQQAPQNQIVPIGNQNQNQLVQVQPNAQIDLPENQNANPTNNNQIMQMYKQNPNGMFVGANLSNCTININMPK